MSIEAMKLAFDALQGSGYYDTTQQREAITALRQAIEQAEKQKQWTPDDMAYRPGGLSMEQEHDLNDVRCECCGYMTYHREHMGCIKAAYQQAEKQEPVAYRYRVMSGVSSGPCWTFTLPQPEAILETQPLYAAPPKAEKQEPVAWADQYDLERDWHDFLVSRQKTVKDTTPLYTAPPKREWVGLTDEEIYFVIRPLCNDDTAAMMLVESSMDEYRAIEAKLKEKNT